MFSLIWQKRYIDFAKKGKNKRKDETLKFRWKKAKTLYRFRYFSPKPDTFPDLGKTLIGFSQKREIKRQMKHLFLDEIWQNCF